MLEHYSYADRTSPLSTSQPTDKRTVSQLVACVLPPFAEGISRFGFLGELFFCIGTWPS